MEYVRLGRTGLKVSRICLGCMSYGEPSQGNMSWTLGFDEAKPFYRRAIEAGINFFDTADVYSFGSSEEYTGKLVREYLPRTQAVIATKAFNATKAKPGPNETGLSRKHILDAVDASLKRLGTDYIDLYQIHRFDRNTPIEETMQALDDVVRAGKVRYIGASSMHAYQFAEMNGVAKQHGWTTFVSMQNLHNLVWREEERQMNEYCAANGIGLIPWSPLAGGFLALDWRTTERKHSARTRSGQSYSVRTWGTPEDYKVLDTLIAVSKRIGRPMAQVALAWSLTRPGMTAPIIGATKMPQLEDSIAAVDLKLPAEELKLLDESYTWNRNLGMIR
jgi:aryl-alcohol dehydrogenase-like predicted oxidoreductase